MTIRDAIVEEARKYLGVPWVHQGRNIHGVDCLGLIDVAVKKLGINIEHEANYSRFYNPGVLVAELFKYGCKQIDKEQGRHADLLLIKVGKFPTHIGFLTFKGSERWFLHSFEVAGHVREERMHDMLWRRVSHAFKLPGL